MRRTLPFLMCLVLGGFALLASMLRGAATPPPPAAVARVGGAVLTEAELARRLAELDPCCGKMGASCDAVEHARQREEAIRAWSFEQLMYQEGLRQGLDRTDPVVRQRIVNAVYEGEVLSRSMTMEPLEEELRAFYAANPDRFRRPAERTGYDVAVESPAALSESARASLLDGVAAALDRDVDAIEAALVACEKAGAVVRVASANDTELTWEDVRRGSGREVADAFFSDAAKSGAVRVEHEQVVHLVRATKFKPAIVPAFELVRSDVEREYRNQCSTEAYHRLLATLAERLDAELPEGTLKQR